MSRIAPPPIPFSQVLAEELATIDRASVDAGAAGSESNPKLRRAAVFA